MSKYTNKTQKDLTNLLNQKNNLKNQLKLLERVKKYFIHSYIGHEKQPPIIKEMPKHLIDFIKSIEKLETEIQELDQKITHNLEN